MGRQVLDSGPDQNGKAKLEQLEILQELHLAYERVKSSVSIQICCIHLRASLRVVNCYIIRFMKSLQKLYEMCECEILDIVR